MIVQSMLFFFATYAARTAPAECSATMIILHCSAPVGVSTPRLIWIIVFQELQ